MIFMEWSTGDLGDSSTSIAVGDSAPPRWIVSLCFETPRRCWIHVKIGVGSWDWGAVAVPQCANSNWATLCLSTIGKHVGPPTRKVENSRGWAVSSDLGTSRLRHGEFERRVLENHGGATICVLLDSPRIEIKVCIWRSSSADTSNAYGRCAPASCDVLFDCYGKCGTIHIDRIAVGTLGVSTSTTIVPELTCHWAVWDVNELREDMGDWHDHGCCGAVVFHQSV